MTHISFDPRKSRLNAFNHGIAFSEARRLWDDPFRVVVPLHHRGEKRYLLIARYEGSLWTAVCTDRGNAVRIISVRKADRMEVSEYDRRRNSHGRGY